MEHKILFPSLETNCTKWKSAVMGVAYNKKTNLLNNTEHTTNY